ncbi:MAG: RluA family pseudouridine synthase [Clostridia bacterium]|nr:RluA family pseudouridine synthase [Clostridia bacterium]
MLVDFSPDSLIYEVELEEAGLPVSQILTEKMQMSSRGIRKAKSLNLLTRNGKRTSASELVSAGDRVCVRFEKEKNIFEPDQAIEIDVVYEDCDVLVINKQPFVVVHPTKGHPTGTIGNGVAYYFSKSDDDRKIRFINRLDRDTSGLMLIAKNSYAQQAISNQMINNTVKKGYRAIVSGHLDQVEGTLDYPIDRETEGDILRKVLPHGLPSVTHYKVIKEYEHYSFVEIILETGRTHQIRVHFSHIGHVLVGDELYGGNHKHINRQALHCYEMAFDQPRTGERISLICPCPEDMRILLEGDEA